MIIVDSQKFSSDYFLKEFIAVHNFDSVIEQHDLNHCIAGAPTAPIPSDTRLHVLGDFNITLPPILDSLDVKRLFNNEAATAALRRLIDGDLNLRQQFLLPKNEVLAGFLDCLPISPKDYIFSTIGCAIGQPEEAIIPFFKDTLLMEFYRVYLQNIIFSQNIIDNPQNKKSYFTPPSPDTYNAQIYNVMPLFEYPENIAFICNNIPIDSGHEAIYESEEPWLLATASPLIFLANNHPHFLFGSNITVAHFNPSTNKNGSENLWQALCAAEQFIEYRFWQRPQNRIDIVGKGYTEKMPSPYRANHYYSGALGPHNVFTLPESEIINTFTLPCRDLLTQADGGRAIIQKQFKL